MIDLKTLFPKASKSFLGANPLSLHSKSNKTRSRPSGGRRNAIHEANHQREIQDSEPQRDETPALDSADAGETKGVDRVVVRFTGFRVRPLDPDNFAGSVKDLLDGCVRAGLLHGDEWWRIELVTTQKKVRRYTEEKTLIEITSQRSPPAA